METPLHKGPPTLHTMEDVFLAAFTSHPLWHCERQHPVPTELWWTELSSIRMSSLASVFLLLLWPSTFVPSLLALTYAGFWFHSAAHKPPRNPFYSEDCNQFLLCTSASAPPHHQVHCNTQQESCQERIIKPLIQLMDSNGRWLMKTGKGGGDDGVMKGIRYT